MPQIWIDIEDNENCGYFPMQTFEQQGDQESGASIIIPEISGKQVAYEAVGWCSDNGGSPCAVTATLIGDSGAGRSRLIMGGNHGVRLRPAHTGGEWSLSAPDQFGEPYILLSEDSAYELRS